MIAFCYLGAVLPIWSFAQPVNYVSFWIVAIGMVGGVLTGAALVGIRNSYEHYTIIANGQRGVLDIGYID